MKLQTQKRVTRRAVGLSILLGVVCPVSFLWTAAGVSYAQKASAPAATLPNRHARESSGSERARAFV